MKKKNQKEKQIKKRTIRYFIQQKALEFLYLPLIIIIWIIFAQAGYWFDKITSTTIPYTTTLITFWNYLAFGFLGIVGTLLTLAVLFVFYFYLSIWIKANWKKASRRASEDFQ